MPKGFRHSEETKRRISILQKGQHHSPTTEFKKGCRGKKCVNWKGGVIKQGGYYYIFNPSHPHCDHHGYVKKSRLVMEKHLGRYLSPTEKVHHINKVRDDDRLINLKLFSSDAEHQAHCHGEPNVGQIKKGQHLSPRTQFKKGNTPWNKK